MDVSALFARKRAIQEQMTCLVLSAGKNHLNNMANSVSGVKQQESTSKRLSLGAHLINA